MTIADVQVRHLDFRLLRLLLVLEGKFVLFQTLNELVNFVYLAGFAATLHQHAYGDVFRCKHTDLNGI
jgi:hypothetical protein